FPRSPQCGECGSPATPERGGKGSHRRHDTSAGVRPLLAGGVPADHGVGDRVGRGEIGLDIEEGGLVEAVEAHDRKARTFDAQQPRHAHGDRVGPGRRAQRERAAPDAVVPRHLQHQIAPRPAHPIKHHQVGAGLDPRERLSPALVDDEGANGVGFARIFRAVLAPRPGRADAADEIERGVKLCRQFDRDFAIADAEGVVVHGLVLASTARVWLSRWPVGSSPAMTAGGTAAQPALQLPLKRIKICLYAGLTPSPASEMGPRPTPMPTPAHLPFEALYGALKAAAEATRLRILALLGEAELTVSDLTAILRQSQPRISRHLRLLVQPGLVDAVRDA